MLGSGKRGRERIGLISSHDDDHHRSLPLRWPNALSSTTSTLTHPRESATLLHQACLLQHPSRHRPRHVRYQVRQVLHQRPRRPPWNSDYYVRLRGRLLDKSHNSASLYLSILLVRARYSPPGDLDRRWDHTEDFLASSGHLGRTGLKR